MSMNSAANCALSVWSRTLVLQRLNFLQSLLRLFFPGVEVEIQRADQVHFLGHLAISDLEEMFLPLEIAAGRPGKQDQFRDAHRLVADHHRLLVLALRRLDGYIPRQCAQGGKVLRPAIAIDALVFSLPSLKRLSSPAPFLAPFSIWEGAGEVAVFRCITARFLCHSFS